MRRLTLVKEVKWEEINGIGSKDFHRRLKGFTFGWVFGLLIILSNIIGISSMDYQTALFITTLIGIILCSVFFFMGLGHREVTWVEKKGEKKDGMVSTNIKKAKTK